jgi:hypothetical protein
MDEGSGGASAVSGAGPDARRPATSWRRNSVFRRALGPLLAYHALILLGAYLVVAGSAGSMPDWIPVGLGLIGAGIVVAIGVLAWASLLTRRAGRRGHAAPGSSPSTVRETRWLCWACGWHSESPEGTCPRCGKPMVAVPSRAG